MGTPPGVEVAEPWGVPWDMPGGESGVGGGARMGPGPCGGGEEAAAPAGGGPVGGGPVGGALPGGGGGLAFASSSAFSRASCSSHCCGVMLPGIHACVGPGLGLGLGLGLGIHACLGPGWRSTPA